MRTSRPTPLPPFPGCVGHSARRPRRASRRRTPTDSRADCHATVGSLARPFHSLLHITSLARLSTAPAHAAGPATAPAAYMARCIYVLTSLVLLSGDRLRRMICGCCWPHTHTPATTPHASPVSAQSRAEKKSGAEALRAFSRLTSPWIGGTHSLAAQSVPKKRRVALRGPSRPFRA